MGFSTALSAKDRPTLELNGNAARLVVDLGGGSISDFHLGEDGLNPLQWDSWSFGDTPEADPPLTPRSMGHFLALDRWGPATEAEMSHGMGFHGEASVAWWSVRQAPVVRGGVIEAKMGAVLPLAGLEVVRSIRMREDEAVFAVTESVTNTGHLGRIYNIVQHPTIGPPFLDGTTIVDSNAARGFMQETPGPDFEIPEVRWPNALKKDGTEVDMRRLTGDHAPNVVSYLVDGEFGWTTAVNASAGLLLGYLWPAADYPWFDAWRHVIDGRPFARGLEFGTTGLHQPGPVLVQKGRIFDERIFRFIDADETQDFSFAGFLMEIPGDFNGVDSVSYDAGTLTVTERGGEGRGISMRVGDLFPAE